MSKQEFDLSGVPAELRNQIINYIEDQTKARKRAEDKLLYASKGITRPYERQYKQYLDWWAVEGPDDTPPDYVMWLEMRLGDCVRFREGQS